MAAHLTDNIKLRIDRDLREALEQLAQEGDRSLAAEMRRALRAYVVNAPLRERIAEAHGLSAEEIA